MLKVYLLSKFSYGLMFKMQEAVPLSSWLIITWQGFGTLLGILDYLLEFDLNQLFIGIGLLPRYT